MHILTCAEGNSRGWCQVRYKGKKGFVAAGALAPSGAHGVQVAALATRYSARVHAQPNSASNVVTVIPPDTVVKAGNCVQGWHSGWCHVTYSNKVGYVRQSLLKRQNAVLAR